MPVPVRVLFDDGGDCQRRRGHGPQEARLGKGVLGKVVDQEKALRLPGGVRAGGELQLLDAWLPHRPIRRADLRREGGVLLLEQVLPPPL